MKIMLISGSISQTSYTKVLLKRLELCLQKQGVSTVFWDLRTEPLPITQPEYHWSTHTHPNAVVRNFVEMVDIVDGLALGSPLYHGSFSGVLKNALDNLRYDAFRNKVVALLSHGSSIRRCTQPCEHLRTVVSTMYGYSTQTLVATIKADFHRNGDELLDLVNSEIIERLERQATELIQLTSLFKNLEKIT